MDRMSIIKCCDIIGSKYQGRFFDIDGNIPIEDELKIDELKRSIEENGLLQAVIVKQNTNGKYELIDGHRRLMAYKRIGFTEINAIIKSCTDKEAQISAIIGNLQRKNLSPIEMAFAFKKILNQKLFADQRELSIAIGKDETYVGDVLNLLKMDKRIIDDLIETRAINDVRLLRILRNAYPLTNDDYNEQQYETYCLVKTNKLNRAQLRQLIIQNKGLGNINSQRININIKKTIAELKINLKGVNKSKLKLLKELLEKHSQQINNEINILLSTL